MVFFQEFNSSKRSLVSGTLLSILVNLNNAIVWMVSTCPLISNSFILFTKPLGIAPSVPITTAITVTFMFRVFFSSLARSRYRFRFLLILLCGLPKRQSPLLNKISFFFLTITRLVVWPRFGDLFVSLWPRYGDMFVSQFLLLLSLLFHFLTRFTNQYHMIVFQ